MHAFNGRYIHIVTGGVSWILRRSDEELIKPVTFQEMHLEPVIIDFDDDNEPIVGSSGEVWWHSPDHALARGGLAFDPTQDYGVVKNLVAEEDAFNTWHGFAIEPKEGDWSLLRDLMKDDLYATSEAMFNYAIHWLNKLARYPELQAETALVLGGEEGIGKGTLARAVMGWFGPHATSIINEASLTGRFNVHLRNKAFVFIDELFAGNKNAWALINALITEERFEVELKFGGRFMVDNHLSFMIASNNPHIVQASRTARRWAVTRGAETHMNDTAHFKKIDDQLKAGGLAAFLYAMRREMAPYNVRAIPNTVALSVQKLYSMRHDPWGWWHNMLRRGYLYELQFGNAKILHKWPAFVSMRLAHAGYLQWASRQRVSGFTLMTDAELGKFLAQDVKLRWGRPRKPTIAGAAGEIVGERPPSIGDGRGNNDSVEYEDHVPGYYLLDLHTMREQFASTNQMIVDWPPDEEPPDARPNGAGGPNGHDREPPTDDQGSLGLNDTPE